MCNRLVSSLGKYNILYKHQYGFRSKHSTIRPILYLFKYITYANDYISKDIAMAVFLDLSKTFDTINHDFCGYINDDIMELEASVIHGSPVTSLIVDSTLK